MLTYNSDEDLFVLLPQLVRQEGIRSSLIVVDNASAPESVRRIREWTSLNYPDAVVGPSEDVQAWAEAHPEEARTSGRVFVIFNRENRGYSAGNNVGLRFAGFLGADAALIANPDMRIEDTRFLARLAEPLFADERHCVAASRVVGLDGKDQNPQREPSFWEELLWPAQYVRRWFGFSGYVTASGTTEPRAVPKVSGCCLLLRLSFLKEVGFLDENVFLYCEEAILAARIRSIGGRIVYVPDVTAVHAHRYGAKGNSARHIEFFVQSRGYYLRTYSGYSPAQLTALALSYRMLQYALSLKQQLSARGA
ncbi:MAG: glycosyltransferase family 2 protein [Myxococcaceae bacterium]|nr:glycosyltransferase family 2 protein [Myxococcaceae bacterium]